MQVYTIVDTDYDAALKQAQNTYGASVRILSRRDFVKKRLFSSKRFCEITLYLVEERVTAQDGTGN
jgi:flagellar biosynthesis GTPase FlhF